MATYKILTKWQTFTYDVWGNKSDGFEVNNVFGAELVDHVVTLTGHNLDKPELTFYSGSLTDKQVRESLDIKPRVQIEDNIMAENAIYPVHCSTGYPLGEMRLKSPARLSVKPSEIIIDHVWEDLTLYFLTLSGDRILVGHVGKNRNAKWSVFYIKQSDFVKLSGFVLAQKNLKATAMQDLMEWGISHFMKDYQFTTKYVNDPDKLI